jgi:peptidoglycan/LPS O-acetylase OafA/YrhL
VNRNNYFLGLDPLRFFAALMVLLGHVDLVKSFFNLQKTTSLFERMNFGGTGVNFFFVLSGFLITYLLLSEKDKHTTISLKNFYARRVLRIWPLYYLILIIGFFILPHINVIDLSYYKKHFEINYTSNLILYLFLLPQLAFSIYPAVPHIGQSWSIGVEEQFYIFWPLFIKYFKNTQRIIINIGILYILFKIVLLVLYLKFNTVEWIVYVKNYFVMCRFENMLIGAWGAYIFFHNKTKVLNAMYNKYLFIAAIILIPITNWFLYENLLQNASHIFLSVCFIIIILNISTNKNVLFTLNYAWLNYLGKISYGIYMYHLMIIPMVIVFFIKFFSFDGTSFLLNFSIYVTSILLSIIISSISYRFFESYFLKFKSKFGFKE